MLYMLYILWSTLCFTQFILVTSLLPLSWYLQHQPIHLSITPPYSIHQSVYLQLSPPYHHTHRILWITSPTPHHIQPTTHSTNNCHLCVPNYHIHIYTILTATIHSRSSCIPDIHSHIHKNIDIHLHIKLSIDPP